MRAVLLIHADDGDSESITIPMGQTFTHLFEPPVESEQFFLEGFTISSWGRTLPKPSYEHIGYYDDGPDFSEIEITRH